MTMTHTKSNNTTKTPTTTSNPVGDRLLKTFELQQRLGVGKRTLLRWIHEGILPAIRPPGVRAYRFDWVTIREAMLQLNPPASAK